MVVKLSAREMAQCSQAAAMRWQLARASDVGNQRRDGNRDDDALDRLGVMAELVVAKIFDLDHQHLIGVDDGTDLWVDDLSIDVKATFHDGGHLLFKSREAFKADCSVLVCQLAPDTYRVAGYASKQTFLKKAQEKDFGHGPGWALEQEELDPLGKLWQYARSLAVAPKQMAGA